MAKTKVKSETHGIGRGTLGKTVCVDCGQGGGKFLYRERGWVHRECDAAPKIRDTAKGFVAFETMNVSPDPNLGPVRVESLRQLRRLEKENGVACAPYSNDGY